MERYRRQLDRVISEGGVAVPVPQPPLDAPGARPATAPASDLLLEEFIHRSANDFAVACAEVHMASRMPSLAAVRDRLQVVVARLHALAAIQRMLQPSRGKMVDVGNSLCELCRHHAEARFADLGAFIQLRTCEGLVDAERGSALMMIVSELLTNAARHAFSGPGGLVEVDVTKSDDAIVCQISDNGMGFSAVEKDKRHGAAIIAELARSADIELILHARTTGTRFELRVPCVPDKAIITPSGD